jgi:hypothetical protein
VDATNRPRRLTKINPEVNGYLAAVLNTLTPEGAGPADPRLRLLLSARYEWIKVHAAGGLRHAAGQAETEPVLDALLQAWSATASQLSRSSKS